MGWNSGTELFDRIISIVEPVIHHAGYDDETKEGIYTEIIDAFRDLDWDDLGSSEYAEHYMLGKLLRIEEDEE